MYVPLNLVDIVFVCQLIVSIAEPLPHIDHHTSNEGEIAKVPKPVVQSVLQSQ